MTKEIIIDGVNVKECDYKSPNEWLPARWDCNISLYKDINGVLKWKACEDCPNCYFKQLARERQKNKELEEKLAQEKEDCTITCPNVQLMERYEQALKEIREDLVKAECSNCEDSFCEVCEIYEWKGKINEVLDENKN